MLTPEQIAGLQIAAGRITDPINDYLLRDIARRIQDAGGLTSTAAYELYRSKLLGSDMRQIKAKLAKLLRAMSAPCGPVRGISCEDRRARSSTMGNSICSGGIL